MTLSNSEVHRSPELTEMVEKIILQANEPMDIGQIAHALPVSFRKDDKAIQNILEHAVHEGRIFAWKPRARSRKERFWKISDNVFCRQLILSKADAKPLSEKDLLQTSRSRFFGMSNRAILPLVTSSLKALIAEGRLFVHPPRQARHRIRYATVPVDPSPYIAKLRAEFDRVVKLLQHSGVGAEDILHRLGGNSLYTSAPLSDGRPADESAPLKEDTEIPLSELADTLLHTISSRIPGAGNRVPIWLPELRKFSNLSKVQFDRAVLYLARKGKLHLDRHTHPGSLTEETRKPFVQDEEGVSYVAAVLL